MKLFLDCLGREIKVGDVLANGQRQGSHGGMNVGIVTGFTEKTILADMLHGNSDYWEYYETRRHTSWTLRKGHFNAPYNCCITGMSEADLRKIAGLNVLKPSIAQLAPVSTPIADQTPRLRCAGNEQTWKSREKQ